VIVEVDSLGSGRYLEALAVLRAAFETVREQFGITRENNPHYPVYWGVGDVARAVSRPARLLGVELDSVLVGCAFVGPSTRREGCWELRHLAVVPEARHLGIGEALIRAATEGAVSDGAEVLRIGIVAENLPLAQWYRRLGFRTVSQGESYPPLPFTVDHLELPLRLSDKSI
jgi:ribosomal protein S18 acetylase RimI-like enzyme